jgi:ABC-2 type transport system permease protein
MTDTQTTTPAATDADPGGHELGGVQVVRLIARREIRERAMSKLFIGSTIVTLVIILAAAILPAFFGGETVHRIGLLGLSSESIANQFDRSAVDIDPDARIETSLVADETEAEALVRDGELDVVLVRGQELIVAEELDDRLGALIGAAYRQAALAAALNAAGVPSGDISAALEPPELAVRALDPLDTAGDQRRFLAFVGTVLLYLQLMMAGSMVASGVVEEKASRVVELLLAKARPTHLLAGKLLGMGLLSFGQLAIFIAGGLAAASAAGTIELPPETIRVGIEVLAWFLLGYTIYAALFAVAGALAGRPEDLQSTSQVVTLVVLAGYAAAIATVTDPGGTIARISTFVPITAPMVQPVRSAAGLSSWWEVTLGVVLVVVGIVVALRLAARVYAGGALHFQGTLKLRDAWGRAKER